MRRPSNSRSRLLAIFAGACCRVATSVVLLLGLNLSSTAVLAYPEFLPERIQRAIVGFMPDNRPGLPHVAHTLVTNAMLRIVAFGSSSTEGIGASTPAAAYPVRLQVALRQALPKGRDHITVLNRGIGGETVDDMLARLDRDVIASRPDVVIWQTGSNDPLRGVSLDHFRVATTAAVQRIREAGIDVILMEPQWCPKLDATPGAYQFRDAVREIGAELQVPTIRRSEMMRTWISEGTLTREQLFAADGLHMADRGYDLLGQAVAEEMLQAAGRSVAAKVASLNE